MEIRPSVSHVHSFWNTEACGTHFVETCADEMDFFEKFREHRYRTEWHIPLLVPFAEAKGLQILEMLYHRHSFNYYDRIMTAMRLRVLLSILNRAGRWRADRERIRAFPLAGASIRERLST
jgi:hypothetical protein